MISKKGKRIIVLFIILILVIYGIVNIKDIGKRIYTIKYRDEIEKYAKEYSIDPLLVSAIISVESKYKKDAISYKGALGLMQILPTTGKWAAEEIGIKNYNDDMLFDEDINIKIGCWYLNKLKKQFDSIELVIAAYNGGSGNVAKWLKCEEYSDDNITLKKIPFKETEDYVRKVMRNYKIYTYIYIN